MSGVRVPAGAPLDPKSFSALRKTTDPPKTPVPRLLTLDALYVPVIFGHIFSSAAFRPGSLFQTKDCSQKALTARRRGREPSVEVDTPDEIQPGGFKQVLDFTAEVVYRD